MFTNFEILCRKIQREVGITLQQFTALWRWIENKAFEESCAENSFSQNFSSPRSPKQNRVVERKNRSLHDTTWTMLLDRNLLDHFWEKAISTACHILTRCLIRPILKKTPYELWEERNLTSATFIHSDANASFTIMLRTLLENLIQELLKVFF